MSRKANLLVLVLGALFLGVLLYQTWQVIDENEASLLSLATPLPPEKRGIDLPVPHSLGDLDLIELIRNQEALHQIGTLHGRGFPLDDGYVARYQGEEGQATLWVAQAPSAAQAQLLMEQMTESIERGDTGFTAPQELTIGGEIIYSVSGQGQMHYYYQVSDKIVWLAVMSTHDVDIVHATLEAIQ